MIMCARLRKKVFIWSTVLDSYYRREGLIGGIAVQLSCWAMEFMGNGWDVYSLSECSRGVLNKVHFLRCFKISRLRYLLDALLAFVYMLIVRPDVVITRGADRNVSYLSLLSGLFNFKYVYFAASDADFGPNGKDALPARDNKLYLYGLHRLKYVVVQNGKQEALLRTNHFRNQNVLLIPNVWQALKADVDMQAKDVDFLWVSNLRSLKRPEWFIELARRNPEYRFVMIGGSNDDVLYEKCERSAGCVHNLEFLGPKNFDEVNEYFATSKCFVCTSEFEGFPNTFLQAWFNDIPVLTTFDPSGRVVNYGLGVYAADFDELNSGVSSVLSDDYSVMCQNVRSYFFDNHNVSRRFLEFMNFLGY